MELRDRVVSYVRRILSKTQLDRLIYLIDRGMTYNNPHIGLPYIKEHGIKMDLIDPRKNLEELMSRHD